MNLTDLFLQAALRFVFLTLSPIYLMHNMEVTMPVLKLKVSYLLLACVIVGLLALKLPSPGLSAPITSTRTAGAGFCARS
jgi:hypothetical protein